MAAIQSAQTLAGRQSSADLPLRSTQFVCQTDLSRAPSRGPEPRAHQNGENVYSDRLLEFFYFIFFKGGGERWVYLILSQKRLKSAASHCLWIPTRFFVIYTGLSPLVLSLSPRPHPQVIHPRSFFLIQSYSAPSFSPSLCLSNQPASLISGDISLLNCCHPSTFFLIHNCISLHQFTRVCFFCPMPTNVFYYIKTVGFFFLVRVFVLLFIIFQVIFRCCCRNKLGLRAKRIKGWCFRWG